MAFLWLFPLHFEHTLVRCFAYCLIEVPFHDLIVSSPLILYFPFGVLVTSNFSLSMHDRRWVFDPSNHLIIYSWVLSTYMIARFEQCYIVIQFVSAYIKKPSGQTPHFEVARANLMFLKMCFVSAIDPHMHFLNFTSTSYFLCANP